MTDNNEKLKDAFNRANVNRNNIKYKLSRALFDHISYMQSKIRKQLKTFTLLSICGGQRSNFMINSHFENAFTSFSLEQKVNLFQKTINYILRYENQKQQNKLRTQQKQLLRIKNKYGCDIRVVIEVNTGFRSWMEETITIVGFKINSLKKINIDLRNYLIRKSKKKDINCYVLQAIRSSKPQTIRFMFNRKDDEDKYYDLLNQLIDTAYYQFICKESLSLDPGIMKKAGKTGRGKIALQEVRSRDGKTNNRTNSQQHEEQLSGDINESQPQQAKHSISVSYELMRSKDQQQLRQDLKDLIDSQNDKNLPLYSSITTKLQKKIKTQQKNFQNIFKIILPNYSLSDLDSLYNYEPVHYENDRKMTIYRNRVNRAKYKMEFNTKLEVKNLLTILQNVELYKNWNPSVLQGQLKFRISSENCAIFYQKHQKYSQWYRQRDFLYLKHVFTLKNSYYLIDKSFQNTNFIPFSSIQRGNINYCVTRVSPTPKGSILMMQIDLDHGGLLKQSYQEQLTLMYLKGFQNIQKYFSKAESIEKLKIYFYHDWNIEETLQNESQLISVDNLRTEDFHNQQITNRQIDESDLYFSVEDLDKELSKKDEQIKSQHEIQQQQLIQHQQHLKETRCLLPSKITLNEEGRIIVPQKYIKRKHQVVPGPSNPNRRIDKKFEHIILQDNWKPIATGGLQMINQKKIEAQNKVFSFILKKLKQNIFSGKGLTNISLPVQIFNCDSNLSRMCRGLCLAPQFLQKASRTKDPIQRMKFTMVFGISISLFFLDAQKPFNPILGQTYQGTIDGCPIYGQQISHHPPISYFYMIGRGYKLYGAIQAKVNLHLNSADGINQGYYNVLFDDGQKITFTGPAGEVANTTMGGNRQFNFLGKGVYFDTRNRLYSELKFQQQTGMWSKCKWKYRDQVQAQIIKVKQSFINDIDIKIKQKKSPSAKEIDQRYCKLSGRWLIEMLWDNRVYYKTNQNLPFQMINQEYPLPSDVFYREDIYYRIMEDLARSQIQKERLEILQRGDRKFREKYHGPTKH